MVGVATWGDLKTRLQSPSFALCTVHLFSHKLVMSQNGVLVPEKATSVPCRLKISICPGMLQRRFLGLGDCSNRVLPSSQKVPYITEFPSEEQWKLVLLMSKKSLWSAYYGPGSVQGLYMDELEYLIWRRDCEPQCPDEEAELHLTACKRWDQYLTPCSLLQHEENLIKGDANPNSQHTTL